MRNGLKEGVQTKITLAVRKETGKIKGDGLDYIVNTLKYIKSKYGFFKEGDKRIKKRARTAEEIIKSEVMTGCTDYAHLFLALCRAKKIPALYVEAFDNDWLKKPSKSIRGHILVRVDVKGREFVVDPTRGSINVVGSYGKYTPMKEGVDFLTLFPTREIYISAICKYFKIKNGVLS